MEDIRISPSKKKPLVIGNLQFSSSTDFQLAEKDVEIAYSDLRERDDVRKNSLKVLKERISRDKGICYRTDDDYLLRYLRYSKFDCDKAYRSIRNLYVLRSNHPDVFSLPHDLEMLLNSGFLNFLPYTDEDGTVLFWVNFKKWNVDNMNIKDIFILYNAVLDIIISNPHCQVNGVGGIWDFKGSSARQITEMLRPTNLGLLVKCLQDCYPWRIKFIVAINCNPLIRMAFNTMRYFLKKKIADRVLLIGSDLTELHQRVNPAILPKECGGALDESEFNITDLVIENLPYLKYERSFGLLKKN